jgi:hypothetical protein
LRRRSPDPLFVHTSMYCVRDSYALHTVCSDDLFHQATYTPHTAQAQGLDCYTIDAPRS